MKLNKETREFKAEDFLWCKVGLDCWVEVDTEGLGDGEVFIRAKLESIDMEKKMAVVAYEDEDFQGPCDVHITRVFLRDPNLYPDLNDLVDLPILNDAELHQKIRDRFACLNIFTYIGPSLLIVNPFKFLADQYKESAKKECYDCILNPTANKVRDKPPHVWAMAANCYLELYNNKMNQACCVSGESGAGKTVNTKTCMSFLTGMNEIFGKGTTKEGETKIEDKILQCNPILEALGNAKTVRNDNSSRFGKYISLFMHNKMVIGASIESYLLEAIRVTTPNRSERNYHIFYQYLKGAPDSEIKEFKLNRKPFTYSFLEKSGCSEVGTVDDLEEYREHEKSMKILNLQGDWRDGYWRTIALVLQLSNVKYDDSGFNGSNACEISSQALLDDIATIMKVEKKALLDALTTKTSIVMGQEIVIYFDKAGCQGLCEAFSKDIYNKLFSWVIKYLNLALLPEAEKLSGKDPAKIYQKIGLLDIFGFEIFENNSIEQLCINFTNEKLHQLYVEYVFKLEVQTFIDEGLKQFLANLSFNDNQEVLDILAHPDRNKYSVFNLIDDQAATMSKDMNLIDQFNQFHGKNPKMGFNKTKRNIFMIVHTARAVGYTIDGFCEKNKDEVPRPIMRCVLSSKCQRFVDIYCQKIKDGDAAVDYLGETVKKKESFIGYKFRQQMDALMTELRSCQCHFMRCIKPNEQKSATVWTSSLVVLQIRYLGLLDSIKIRKESYPYRFNFVKFVHRYLELEPTYSALTPQELDAKNPDYVNLSNNILKKGIPEHGPKTCLVGKTRVFLKIEAYQRLEAVYEEVVKVKKDAIKALDKILLEVKLKSRIIDFRRKGVVAVELVKQLVFGFKSKQNAMRFKMIRKVAYKLQANYRLQKGLRLFRKKRQSVCTIQSAMEAFIAQKKAKDKVVSAKVIARYYKNYRWCSSLKFYIEILRKVRTIAFESVVESIKRKQEKAAIIIQKNFKGIRCRKENAAEVKKIKIARELFKYNKAMVILKKYLAGRVTRTRIKRVMNAAEKIQAYFKMRWTSEAYQRTREKAIFIQRFVKEWLKRKLVKDRKRMEYLKNEYIPFLKKCYSDQSRLYEIDCGPTKKELSKEVAFEEPKTHQVYQQIPKVDTSSVHKIRFYVDVIDLDYMHDILNSYQGSWSKGYIDAHKDAKKIKTDVRVVEIGSHHTVMATSNGRCYCWGRNDELQLGTDKTEETMAVFRVLKGEERLRQIATGNEHTHVLTKDRTVFSYGRNDKGQLGLGSNKPLDKIELNTSLTKCKLKSIHAKRDSSYAVTEEGEVMFWPISNSNPGIGVLNVGNKETINSIALGDDFAVLLAENGSVYSFGRKNEFGQLGLGHNKPCLVPTILSSLQKERISNISAGRAHVSCLTKNNKIFAWGEGSKGQLGVSALNNYLTPAPVKSFCQTKTVQVCCGIHSTYALQEDGAVYWWGRNSRVRLVQKPSLFRSLEDPELFPVQIRTSWSENLNCAYLIIADLRYVTDLNIAQKHTYAKIMAAKWNSMGNSQFELPPSNAYGAFLTSKNLDLSGTTSDFKRPKPDPLLDFKSFNALPEEQKANAKPEKKTGFKSPVKTSPAKTQLTKSLKVDSTGKKSDTPTSPFNLKDTQSSIKPQATLGKSDAKVSPSKNAQSMKTPSKSPTKSIFKSSVTHP